MLSSRCLKGAQLRESNWEEVEMDEASSADPPGDGGARGSVRVLVADDSAGMRALLCAQFESLHGVQLVGVAVDGAEAVDQAVRQVPDGFAPVCDPQGTVVAAMAVARDVTDQVRAAGRFQLLFDQAPIGIALNGPDGRWLQVNPALCTLLGYSAEDLLARDFQSITHPDDLDASVEQMQRMLAGEIASYELDKRYLHRDGHPVWVHLTVSIVRHDDGTARYFIAQIQDITERRRVEQALRDSEARYRRIVELAHEGIWTIDADARTTFVNARMAEMFGYSAEEMLGRHLSEFMDEDWLACRRRRPRPPPARYPGAARPSSSAAATAASCGRTWRPARSSPTTAATRERSPSSPTSPPAGAPKPSWPGWPGTTR